MNGQLDAIVVGRRIEERLGEADADRLARGMPSPARPVWRRAGDPPRALGPLRGGRMRRAIEGLRRGVLRAPMG